MTMTLEFTVRLVGATRFDKDANAWVGYCPALDMYSQGTSEDESRDALEGAIRLFLVNSFERDQLQSVLKDCGFHQTPKTISVDTRMQEYIQIKELNYDDTFDISVPIHLLAQQQQVAHASM